VKRILFVAMTESVHVARWISQLQDPAMGHPCVPFGFAFDDASASARTYTLVGGRQQKRGSWWALHAFLFQREEGRRTFALLEAIPEAFCNKYLSSSGANRHADGGTGRGVGGHCAEAMGLVISEFRTENARVLVSVRGQPSKGQ
jgi:hypothetical protein